MDERKKLIKMKEVTFEELFRQVHNCLEWKDLQKMRNDNVKLELADMNDNMIESDEAVKKEFESNKPFFKIKLTPFQHPIISGKKKTIKNALVIMIGISEYNDNKNGCNLPGVKEDDNENFKQLFEQELNYTFVCNPSPSMTKEDVLDFIDQVIRDHELRRNTKKYDGLITIICGHGDQGDEGDALVTSDGGSISIDEFRDPFDCNRMRSFKDFPKIFIIDICRSKSKPEPQKPVMRGKRPLHKDDGFLVIWSTTKGNTVADLSLLSKYMKNIVTSTYKSGYPFKQVLQDIRTELRNKNDVYCVESQDTTDYDIVFQQRKSA
ncbi:hypothetical protein RFI_01852 [Reticulomyxa filosa]|uniref:Caspase family p20 domain-containing protein n=1 Tax=Reticulomyxa filosa TaxID=46433 RepID=X6PC24_RETFI|nr:hypothetical protein RFI_01852 [Reticulomyxa filosa]|eukprot:ETO35222.1 hypothetical protein RFI_01852 [Reticulomyxa filosa]